jgi:hypothetical protein
MHIFRLYEDEVNEANFDFCISRIEERTACCCTIIEDDHCGGRSVYLIAAHESPRTIKLYDRTSKSAPPSFSCQKGDDISLDDIERIAI